MSQSVLRNWILLRLFIAGVLCLFLLIPVALVQGLIEERQIRRNEAVDEVTGKWGGDQTLVGPVLSVPLRWMVSTEKGKTVYESGYVHCLPDSLEVSTELVPSVRYRGIYRVVLYSARLSLRARFALSEIAGHAGRDRELFWDAAFVTLGVSDLKGIKDIKEARWNGKTIPPDPGVRTDEVIRTGITMPPGSIEGTGQAELQLTGELNGSEQIQIVPAGKVTEFHAASAWADPSFVGSFLPTRRNISGKDFTADWRVLHLNRSFPQYWTGGRTDLASTAFGVRLMVPIDEYQKNSRAAKYAILFIALIFLAFGITDVLARIAFHPIHYLLVTLALILFYVLLLSFSEQVGFNWAYLIASSAIIGLVLVYLFGTTRRAGLTATLGGLLAGQYLFLFVLMQLEDYALLVGSLGLFVMLALVMYLTRKIDWFAIGGRLEGPASGEAAPPPRRGE
jgi:inner membrane protein